MEGTTPTPPPSTTERVPGVQPPDPTRLEPGDYTSTIILNSIYRKILNMITSLQDVAASQANRLTFLSNWQKAYTTLNADIPVFTAGSGPFGSGSATSARGEVNQLNSSLTATVQNRQSVVSDDAKALQSNVNQSNDSVNQQSNLGTSIIQELSTLLSAIFK